MVIYWFENKYYLRNLPIYGYVCDVLPSRGCRLNPLSENFSGHLLLVLLLYWLLLKCQFSVIRVKIVRSDSFYLIGIFQKKCIWSQEIWKSCDEWNSTNMCRSQYLKFRFNLNCLKCIKFGPTLLKQFCLFPWALLLPMVLFIIIIVT